MDLGRHARVSIPHAITSTSLVQTSSKSHPRCDPCVPECESVADRSAIRRNRSGDDSKNGRRFLPVGAQSEKDGYSRSNQRHPSPCDQLLARQNTGCQANMLFSRPSTDCLKKSTVFPRRQPRSLQRPAFTQFFVGRSGLFISGNLHENSVQIAALSLHPFAKSW